jgi:hypothetical protein
MGKDLVVRPPRDPISHHRGRAKRFKNGGQNGHKRAVAAALKSVLTDRILKLRIQGLSEREIAKRIVEKEQLVEKLSPQLVHTYLIEALDGIAVPEADKLKRMELQRLDTIINGHYQNATEGDVGATHAVLACIDRRNRLLGIGQETKVSTQQLGADGRPVDPIRPVINLTIARIEKS